MKIRVNVVGDPQGQPRHRAASLGGHARVYNPTRRADGRIHPIVPWREAIKAAAMKRRPESPMTGPVSCEITLRFRRPKSHYGTGGNLGKLKASAPYWHTKKPDRDNADKAVLDVLTECCYWLDDAQVCDGGVRKRYVTPGEVPGATIAVCEITPA